MDFADGYNASQYNSDTDMQSLTCAGYSAALGIYTIGSGYTTDCSCSSTGAAARRAVSLTVTFTVTTSASTSAMAEAYADALTLTELNYQMEDVQDGESSTYASLDLPSATAVADPSVTLDTPTAAPTNATTSTGGAARTGFSALAAVGVVLAMW